MINPALALSEVAAGGSPALAFKGRVTMRAWRRGRLLWEIDRDNLVVTAGLTPVANLLAGIVTNQSIAAIGFGSGTAAPALTDTALTAPAYYRAIGTSSFPAAGQVLFNWSLTTAADAAAFGITIGELGLLVNTGPAVLPFSQASGGAAPSMTLFARILLGLGTFASGMNFSGTWTITT